LTSSLKEKYPKLQKINFQIARNNQLINENQALVNNDVLAFLPPFAGG
jgi:molybdopterin converting factor small subunit